MLRRPSIKVVVAGPPGVGKTAFGQRFATGQFHVPRSSTVGLGFVSRTVFLNGMKKYLNLWDATTTHLSFRSSLDLLFEGVDGVLLLVDAVEDSCEENLSDWLKYAQEYAPGVPYLVVYHKCDRLEQSSNFRADYLQRRNIPYIFSSSMLNIGVDGAVALLLTMLIYDHRRCSTEMLTWPPRTTFMVTWWNTLKVLQQSSSESSAESGACRELHSLQVVCCAKIFGLLSDVEQLLSLHLPGSCNHILQQMFIQWPPERQVSKLCLLLTGGCKPSVSCHANTLAGSATSVTALQCRADDEVQKAEEQQSSPETPTESQCSKQADPSQKQHKLFKRLSSLKQFVWL